MTIINTVKVRNSVLKAIATNTAISPSDAGFPTLLGTCTAVVVVVVVINVVVVVVVVAMVAAVFTLKKIIYIYIYI